ncbi:hypothetical protein GA0115240_15228 [Streptomyces sp. DvalAA-14]|uniref:hypothetical protein n=1 Tax=unclassified Streptomyces TaxID=2593676 RepID=UPI00081B8098|nr:MULTISPECIES: hypothetical protein [unclassified Streptomyces]MYS23339.1 hypothetical protein [Streptomyces sp. SID4948]SCE31878.1 hypothetical protein GA0115240_15228 [Streptomyces sp. DvalAA-14]
MPIETDDGNSSEPLDLFGDQFGRALRHTADAFQPDGRPLVAGGHTRGRRLRRRRTAVVTAGVAVVALAGAGGGLAAGIGGTAHGQHRSQVAAPPAPVHRPSASPTPTGKPALTGQQVAGIFLSLLPKAKISGVVSRGTEDGIPYVHVVYDDGLGPAAVEVSIGMQEAEQCPAHPAPGTSCGVIHTRGGDVTVLKGYEYPDHRADTKDWVASYPRPNGAVVEISEWNAPQEKDAPVTRPTPPLSAKQLASIVTSPRWQRVIDALPQ